MKTSRVFFVIFLILSFCLSPINFNGIVYQPTSAQVVNEISVDTVWNTNRNVGGFVSVAEGITLTIEKGVTITFEQDAMLAVAGKLDVRGTVKEPVTIVGLNGESRYSIVTGGGGKIKINNADISGGGGYISVFIIGNEKPTIINKAYAFGFYRGAISVENAGELEIQGSKIHDNGVGVMINGDIVSPSVKVNRSEFYNNQYFDVLNQSGGSADFQYNWWGNSSGPNNVKIQGDINDANWRTEEDFIDPVIIIPGVMGSWEKDGVWQLDPLLHTYDNLYNQFVDSGYVPGSDLFVFPYQWRDSNIQNAIILKDRINTIKQIINWPKIDIVAHSMGGLLAREYIESDYYQGDVDQLVTLATPNLGAPEAYVKWDGDGWFFSAADIYMKNIIKQEAEEGEFADIFDYIHNRPITSLKELLPIYDYLYEVINNYALRIYPNNYPRNEFLENLDNNSDKLGLVEYDKIVGNIVGENTIGGINVIDADMGKYWQHGYPHGFEIPTSARGMRLANGDRTVPIDSARSENIKADYLIESSSDHRGIVTDAQSDVLELLTGVRPAQEVRKGLIKNIFMAQVYSPVDIQIVAPDGQRIGKDFDTGETFDEIPDAFYTGYNTDTEFIVIPNPQNGEYRILTQGTGEGSYRIETTNIAEDAVGVAIESAMSIEGTAVTGQQDEAIINVQGSEMIIPDEEVTLDTIEENISQYYSQGLINEKNNKSLVELLEKIRKEITKQEGKNSNEHNGREEKRIAEINKQIDKMIEYINKNLGKGIDQVAGQDLISKLGSLK